MESIKYYKWKKKELNLFKKSCNDILKIKEMQLYQPYYSLYFYIHNTKDSHKLIDIDRRYFIKEVLNIEVEKYHTSNINVSCKIFDKKNSSLKELELFCKCIPLLDPLHIMMNNYNNVVHRNPLLPSCYNHNTQMKINDMCNTAYIDTFMSYICSELTINDILPTFPIFYGSINGIKESFNYDLTDEYHDYKQEKWFHKNLGKTYSIDMYISSDDESDVESDNESDISDNGEYISLLKDIPVQMFFIEKLEGTLEDLLNEDIEKLNADIIKSSIFQVSFALAYLQKHYLFTHNDLHINNVMFQKTDKQFIYYKVNNLYYKVPTHGYLFKIIDFGRCIFTYRNKLFFNDTFYKHSEAGGQYTDPNNHLLFKQKEEEEPIQPNYNFDLCRLAITILDVCNYDKTKEIKNNISFIDFIHSLTLTNEGESLFDLEDDFDMYVSIAKYSSNSRPSKVLQNYIFNDYKVKKKYFPKKLYYKLD